MNKDFLVNKLLPVVVVVITTILLAVSFFVALFSYIEKKQISSLEKKGAVEVVDEIKTNQRPYVFSEAAKARFIKPGGKPYVFSEAAKARFIKPGGKPYVFSEAAKARFIKP